MAKNDVTLVSRRMDRIDFDVNFYESTGRKNDRHFLLVFTPASKGYETKVEVTHCGTNVKVYSKTYENCEFCYTNAAAKALKMARYMRGDFMYNCWANKEFLDDMSETYKNDSLENDSFESDPAKLEQIRLRRFDSPFEDDIDDDTWYNICREIDAYNAWIDKELAN